MDLKTLWVSPDELKGIWQAIHEHRFNTNEQNQHIGNILMECGVAESRAVLLYPSYERIAVSLGKPEGSIPLKLTAEEYVFLTKLPLTQDLKEILN